MKKLFNLFKWKISRGKDSQNFLGASWIPPLLARLPERSKRKWALRILSLSPHYFIKSDDPRFARMGLDEYLETSLNDIVDSRERIWKHVFSEPLKGAKTVLDFGCGPGFLSAVAAREKETVYAIDISRGALACARIVNPSETIRYLAADDGGIAQIPDGGMDAVMSLAVAQHVGEDILRNIISNCATKLRRGGVLALHVQTVGGVWRSEKEWREDSSVTGQIKLRLGLHCFGRSIDEYRSLLTASGFEKIEARPLTELGLSDIENEETEHLVTAVKS